MDSVGRRESIRQQSQVGRCEKTGQFRVSSHGRLAPRAVADRFAAEELVEKGVCRGIDIVSVPLGRIRSSTVSPEACFATISWSAANKLTIIQHGAGALAFLMSGAGTLQGTLPGPAGSIAPGQSASMVFDLDPMALTSRYFGCASMVIPSNDAFIGNGNPQAIQVFDAAGSFVGGSILVLGSMVWDAGTEVNDEVPMNTAFLGQIMANADVTENGVVMGPRVPAGREHSHRLSER